MSKFTDEIKESMKNFTDPMKQEVKNISKKRIIIPVVIIVLLIGMINNCSSDEEVQKLSTDNTDVSQMSSAANNTNNADNSSIFNDTNDTEVILEHISSHIAYARENNIRIIRFSKEEKALWDWLNSYEDLTPKHLTYKGSLFGESEFKRTENRGTYLYYGELKDNKPHGYGVLYKISENNSYGTHMFFDDNNNGYYNYNRYYVGQFKNGKFDGYGLLYAEEKNAYSAIISRLTRHSDAVVDEAIHYYYCIWGNPVCYFGMFSNGERSGLGNYFNIFSISDMEDDYDISTPMYASVELGEFDGESLNGNGKIYWGGHIYYEGELYNGLMNGQGKLYYFNSDKLEYEGEFHLDKRHGYGKSYSKSGELIYEGEWKNDDYK